MRLFVASSSASVVFFAFLFNLYLGKIDFPWFPGIGMAQLGLWLTPLVVALASVVTLFRLKDGGTGADGDRKQFTVLRGKGRPRVLESASTTWGGLGRSLRTLAPYLWPQESATMQLIILGCFSILAMKRFLNFYVVIVEKQIVDALRKETDFCWELILTFLTLKFGQRVFGSLFFTTWSKVSQYTDREVKLRLFSHLHELSLRWHLERKTGAVMRIMNRGASSLGSLLWFLVFKLIPVTADLIIAVTFLVTTFNFWFGALVFATLGLYLAMLSWSRWYSKHTKSTNMAVNDQESKSLDSILNYATVKHFGAEQYEIERYAGTSSLTMSEQFKLLVLTELLGTIDEFGLHCCLLVGYLYCAHLVADPNKSLTVSDYLLFGRYFNQLTNPLRNLVHVWMNSVQKNVVDMQDMFQLLNEEPEVKDKPGAPPLVFTEGKIEFRDVNFSYNPERAILKNVSFTVNPGETVAFVGPTGAGKSTVVQLLFRFFDVQEGRITIDSQNIRDVTQSSLRRNIGVVPQDTVLFNDTIRYNIRYGKPDATDKEVETAAVNAGLHEKILAFPKGYDTMVGERGLRLSGGEKQRVAIARTLLKSPQILLLDEATSALDTCTERAIHNAISSFGRGRTTVMVAHRLSTVVGADSIMFLKDGAVVESGTHEQLLALDGEYANMWQQQSVARVEGDTLKWRLLAVTNLKGGTDSLFFIYDDDHPGGAGRGPEDLAMLSLNRSDRIRLINFDRRIAALVKTVIMRFFQTKEPEEREYCGTMEFKLKGYPFLSSGSEAVATRQLICRILEALRDTGWSMRATFDISRKPNDKSVFLFERCESAKLKFACLALSDTDTLRLLNFPSQVTTYLMGILRDMYMPGVSDEGARDGSCYEVRLNGSPWSHNSSYNLHARSMLLLALKEAARYGWQLAASADVSAKYVHQENGPDYPADVHSWFFCYQGMMSPNGEVAMPPQTENARSYSELRVSDLEEAGTSKKGAWLK